MGERTSHPRELLRVLRPELKLEQSDVLEQNGLEPPVEGHGLMHAHERGHAAVSELTEIPLNVCVADAAQQVPCLLRIGVHEPE